MADAETPAMPPEEQALAAAIDPKKLTIDIKIYAPFKVYYEGKGYSISAVNETGPFDVLPHHHNFLCMLVPGNLIVETPDGRKIIKVTRALMHVRADRVVVFMDV
jgi:F0F1-type ATP synthase epsilon subunit